MDKIGIYKTVDIHNYFDKIIMGIMLSNYQTCFKSKCLKQDPFVIKDYSYCLFFYVVFTVQGEGKVNGMPTMC